VVGRFLCRWQDEWMRTQEIRVETGSRVVTDLTDEITAFCREGGDGLLSVFVPHATAGVAIMETGAGSEPDLVGILEDLLPIEDRYRHRHGSRGHGRDHVLPAFIAPSITVPVLDGRAALGTWQSIVLVDTNSDNPSRRVRLSFIPG
jgi:secondary thiamine-phosphate synthase enzyme